MLSFVLAFNSSHRPVKPREWRALLDAVYHAERADEQSWLEWKTSINLRSKEHIATVVAKAIIAFANRDPGDASRHVGGIGILLVGIEPGNAVGVQQVDNSDLEKLLTQYIGDDGPIWQPHWDSYNGATVLIIEVSPPAWGDPPHAFRKDYTSNRKGGPSISDGAIFVRHIARSERANHRDVYRLAERFSKRSSGSGLDIAIGVNYEDPLRRISWDVDDLERFLRSERSRLLTPLQEAKSPHLGLGIRGLVAETLAAQPEKRSEAAYIAEVESYLGLVRASWPDVMREIAAYLIPAPKFTVTNLTSRNYSGLEVVFHVDGEADAVEKQDSSPGDDVWRFLPNEPRNWGAYREDPSLLWRQYPYGSLSQLRNTRSTIERDGSFTLKIRPLDLRPEQSLILEDEVVILVPINRVDDVSVKWSATATNIDATTHGEFQLLFDGETCDIFKEFLRQNL